MYQGVEMKELFLDVIHEVYRLDSFLKKRGLSRYDAEREKAYYHNFIVAQERLQGVLLQLHNCSLEDKDTFLKNIVEMHALVKQIECYIKYVYEKARTVFDAYYNQYVVPKHHIYFAKTNIFHKKSKRYMKKHARCLSCLTKYNQVD